MYAERAEIPKASCIYGAISIQATASGAGSAQIDGGRVGFECEDKIYIYICRPERTSPQALCSGQIRQVRKL